MFVDASNSLFPEELHVLAMDCIVGCIPNIDIDEQYTMYKIYGPFKSNIPCEMPLFMALYLQVQIEKPIYYENQELDKLLKKERASVYLTKLPHDQFFEIGFILKHNVKRLNDFRNVRFDKLLALVNQMHPNFVQFGYPTVYECHMIRPLIQPLLCYLHQATPGNTGNLTADQVKLKYNQTVSQIQEE